jgi:hypothetical protein
MRLCTRRQLVDVPEHFVEGNYVNQSDIIHRSCALCGEHVYPVHLHIE